MTSFTPKQLRNIGEAALTGDVPSNAPLSDEQRAQIELVRRQQAAAAQDPYLNGQDAKARLHSG